ncbi:MAG: cytochrome P450 [Mycobacteriales bacterium]
MTPSRSVPVVQGSWLLGSALPLRRDVLGTFAAARARYGDVVRFDAGPPGMRRTFYGAFHPDGVRQVLATDNANYRKDNAAYLEMRALFGDGLLTSQDETWRRQKRFLQPLFTAKRVTGYAGLMVEETAALLDRWRAAPAGHTVELHQEMMRLALRVAGGSLFGADVEAAVPVIERTVPPLARHMIARALGPVRVPRGWPTPGNRRADRYQRALFALCDDLIARRRADGPGRADDLMSLLVAASGGADPLSDTEIRDQVLIFLLAGHDTTGAALSYGLWLLGWHPEVQARARAEVADVLGDRTPTAADADRLSYLNQIVQETLRLYPSAPAIGRMTAAGGELGGYRLPPRAEVFVSPWVTHRHPDFWPDPERFDPDRFAPERVHARPRYAWFPFGGGPRACIGQYFAMLEATLAMAMVLRRFELHTSPEPPAYDYRITLQPATALTCALYPAAASASSVTR